MKRFRFLGTGFEYFKIWIVNILLTIVTLGLYYPWAKVRNNKYIYGNSVLDNRAFDYHATGKQLFFGYVIAFVGVIIYTILEKFSPSLAVVLLLVFMVLIPWILLRSIKFDMLMTSFDNVRFKFDGKLSTMYMIIFVLPIFMVLGTTSPFILLGFFFGGQLNVHIFLFIICFALEVALYIFVFSYIVLKKNDYYYNNLSHGKSKFKLDLQLDEIRKIVLQTTFLGLGILLLNIVILFGVFYIVFGVSISFKSFIDPSIKAYSSLLIFIPLFYFMALAEILLVSVYYQVKIREYIYSKLVLDDKIKFASTFKISSFLWLIVTNLLLIIVTLGLAIPWAKVRLARYTLENTQVSSEIDFDIYLSEQQESISAVGEEIADVTNLEMGFTI